METDRLIIRCYRMEDASMLLKAITDSLDHLRPWMPWAKNPPANPESATRILSTFQEKFHLDEDYFFGIFNKAENELIGSTGLHTRTGEHAREIGYWINVAHLQQGYATEAVSALIKIGFTIENLERIEIRCDPDNLISQKIPQALGFSRIAIRLNDMMDAEGNPRDTMIWSLLRKDFLHSPLRTFPVRAFDKTGREIPSGK
ncbi:MAG TPA: GNAT family protein [Puia sp.]|nr:GNAT family protein [Puia sp.]